MRVLARVPYRFEPQNLFVFYRKNFEQLVSEYILDYRGIIEQ